MKLPNKVSCILVALFILNGLTATQVAGQSKSNVIKINVLSPVAKTFNGQYERAITSKSSLQLGFYYSAYKVSTTKFNGFGITPEYRFYLASTGAPKGVYLAPFARYQKSSVSEGVNKGSLSIIGGGLILGKQWLFGDRVALDLFIGPKYSARSITITSGTDSFDLGKGSSGIGIRGGLCLGIGF